MDILFKNCDWLVINKPTGISTHGAWAGDLGMQEWLALHRGEKTHVCSRLDKGTSGVLLLARTKEASARAQVIHESGLARKTYCFLSTCDSEARFGRREWRCDDPIDGKSACTLFYREARIGKQVLYRAEITRGRMHQIRRHAAASDVPVLGDGDYGGATFPRIALHCRKIEWPDLKEPLLAPLPRSFDSSGLCAQNRDFAISFDRRLSFYTGITTAFRAIHRGEIPNIDCTVDYYNGFLCGWVYEESSTIEEILQRLTPYLDELMSVYGAHGVIIKRANRNPHTQKLVSETQCVGEPPPADLDVSEHGLQFRVHLTHNGHVGLFLDQRDNRRRVYQAAAGKRIANLFAYTSSFSVAAAAGKAEVVFSIDSSKSALDTGKLNFNLNELSESRRGKFIKADVRSWLDKAVRKRAQGGGGYDLIICDPPTFSSTKPMGTFSIEHEWDALARACRSLLEKNGTVFFSSNHRGQERGYYLDILKHHFSSIDVLSPPLDFPTLPGEPEHVKLFRCSF